MYIYITSKSNCQHEKCQKLFVQDIQVCECGER